MSIASFEGKGMYRIDYTTQEVVSRGDTVTKEVAAFFIAETPEDAISTLREALEPEIPTIQGLVLTLAGEDLKYRVAVLN